MFAQRLKLLIGSAVILLSSLTPLGLATAAGTNLITNPSVETADTTGAAPLGWNKGGWGTNTSTLSYKTTEGNVGAKSLYINTTSYTSGDAKWYFSGVSVKPGQKYTYTEAYKSNVATDITIQYTSTTGSLSYVWLGSAAASPNSFVVPTYSFTTPSNVKSLTVFHTINKVGWLQTDDFSLSEDGIVTPPVGSPTIAINSPVNNSIVSGTAQAITSTASADTVGVQFKLDGVNFGTEDTSSPFTTSWNTTTATNGSHTISATARNASGLTATASTTVNVQNSVVTPPPVPTGGNLIANPSFESSTSGANPDGWTGSKWGTNTSSFTYLNSGHSGSRSVQSTVTGYTSGAANWYHANAPVVAGKTYKFENWYKSNVVTEIDATVTLSNGQVQYIWLGSVPASATWAKNSMSFTAPAGAVSVSIYQPLAKVGYVISDDYSLVDASTAPTPPASKFGRAIVSLTFDDGWRSIHANGLPLLKKYGLVSTQYLNSDPVIGGWSDYMSYQMVKDFYAQGSELGWHTRSHSDVTKLTTAALGTQLSIPSTFLQGIGLPASTFTNFATPYGAYNATATNEIKKYYGSNRNTDVGFNSKGSFDLYNIKVQNITNTTTPAQVKAWVDQAIANNYWLVLVYHEVTASAADPTYAVTPANLDLELNYIKQSGVSVQTVAQALNEIKAQL